ncbi:hypothetical protein D7V97_36120 [Corallococcus sp. CA053C]|uniref:DUF6881 domain-containing protein n=1 Tax=Corallococcus sp. CA053C TaxID=2316732 RepID=UPI000EA278F3|nr:hypothetical protein [Corallococcus sp. CA053C]RKG96087.1 hypothetical protein D7V97_36120 [Corallococcus sp. CA053C]
MKYVRIGWKHWHPDEPVTLYSELDDNRFEIRKVEVFRDGRYGYASSGRSRGSTKLGILAMPELSEIAKDPQFEPVAITREEFEDVWARSRLG